MSVTSSLTPLIVLNSWRTLVYLDRRHRGSLDRREERATKGIADRVAEPALERLDLESPERRGLSGCIRDNLFRHQKVTPFHLPNPPCTACAPCRGRRRIRRDASPRTPLTQVPLLGVELHDDVFLDRNRDHLARRLLEIDSLALVRRRPRCRERSPGFRTSSGSPRRREDPCSSPAAVTRSPGLSWKDGRSTGLPLTSKCLWRTSCRAVSRDGVNPMRKTMLSSLCSRSLSRFAPVTPFIFTAR